VVKRTDDLAAKEHKERKKRTEALTELTELRNFDRRNMKADEGEFWMGLIRLK
jgi:hypothetical protein